MEHQLNLDQTNRAIEVMHQYLNAPAGPGGRTPLEVQTERDRRRVELIEKELRPLLTRYLAGDVALTEFKQRIDGLNKRHEYWGFKGIKGQMFFNMVVNVADDEAECDQELKAALAVPANEEIASSRLRTFASYVKRLGEQVLESGGSKSERPKIGSVPFFVSYFWQIHVPEVWPVFYTNSVNVMEDLNLWQPTGDPGTDYLNYKHIHEELARAFTEASKRKFGLYEVEHVFWFKGGNPFGGNKPLALDDEDKPVVEPAKQPETRLSRLPDGYVPPVIAILPMMACSDPECREAAKSSGTSLERAFEKSINAAFTVLGYETKLLGQGQGRVPDGLAIDGDNSYAIIWDAKVRADGYSMGTDDRAIKEYVTTQSRELKRRRGFRNIYYLIVSSHFVDDYDDLIRSLKMETDVNEVCLVEADALIAMVDAKIRAPLQVTLGPDGMQRLFSNSGMISAKDVRENVTGE